MSQKKKSLWGDSFEHITAGAKKDYSSNTQSSPEFVESLWTDKRTGAEYIVREKAPNGPQGDFRVPAAQAEARYRAAMGLPPNTSSAFHERSEDDPFAEHRVGPERAVDKIALEASVRDRAMQDTRREQAFLPSRETPEWAATDVEDRGDHVVDARGRIIDKPFNTRGPYGTEDVRGPFLPSRYTSEIVSESPGLAKAPPKGFMGPERESVKESLQDNLDVRLEKSNLQVLLTNVYRGLFGTNMANNIMTRSDLADRRPGFERPVISHVIIDAGLTKPWEPPPTAVGDRPQKPEALAYAVGARAMATLLSAKVVPEVLDLPKAERDDLTVALGRTILNSMTLMPARSAAEKPLTDARSAWRLEVAQAVAKSISPDILKGLVAPEMLSDRRVIEGPSGARVSAPATSAQMPIDRMPSESSERPVRPLVAARATRPMLDSFGTSRRFKKDLWAPVDDDEETPSRAEESLARSERPMPATQDRNSRPNSMAKPRSVMEREDTQRFSNQGSFNR